MTTTTKVATATATRRCIGSERFGIEAHDAPVSEFPAQPSQKDGLGRMCKPHWREYTNSLRKAALERKAASGTEAPVTAKPVKAATKSERRRSPMTNAPAAKVAKATKAAEPRAVDPVNGRNAAHLEAKRLERLAADGEDA